MAPGRVLVVHNRYQQRGGEDLAFEAESALLEANGHPVDRLVFTNDTISEEASLKARAQLALDTVWSRSSAQAVADRANAFGADVVHFHNTFPLVSAAAFGAARRTGAAVVVSLHNYRFACPSADLFRDGQRCTDCLGRTVPWPGVRHRCYHDSAAQTGVITSALTFHNLRKTWERDVDLFLTPSRATARLLASAVPVDRLRVKPNFVPEDPSVPSISTERSGFLFVGRLTVEKGIRVLLEAWRGVQRPLTVIGDGPLRSLVETAASHNPLIRFVGQAPRSDVLAAMRSTEALIVPSVWDEPFGLVVVEAFASETPVIAARSGALPELVTHDETGLLYHALSANDLSAAVKRAATNPELMRRYGLQARARFETHYTPEINYGMLRESYDEALRRRAGSN